jgi:hypothetical protein
LQNNPRHQDAQYNPQHERMAQSCCSGRI